jgi:hypothetical protein
MGKSGRMHVLTELVNRERDVKTSESAILMSTYHLDIFSRISKGFSIKVRQLGTGGTGRDR